MQEQFQLLDRVRQAVRLRSLSRKTENAYLNHIRHFLEFSGKAEADDVEADEIRAFLKPSGIKRTIGDFDAQSSLICPDISLPRGFRS